MIIPLVLSALWLASAVLFRISGHNASSVFAALLTPAPVLLAIFIRHLALRIAAEKVIRHQVEGGPVPQLEARDLPTWPIRVMVLLALGGLTALGGAIWRFAAAAWAGPG